MQRNTILYILIALLVVVGGTWYALSTQTVDEERENDRTEEEQDNNESASGDNENDAAADEDADGDSVSESGDTDTGTGTLDEVAAPTGSLAETGSQGSTSQGSTGSQGEGGSISGNDDFVGGVGGTEITILEKNEIETELTAQLEIISTIVSVIELQLEEGEISPEEASELLTQVGGALDELGESVDLYLAL